MTGGPSITALAAAVAGHRPGGVRTISTERDLAPAATCYDAHVWVHANGHVVRCRLTAAPEVPGSSAIGRKPTAPLALPVIGMETANADALCWARTRS
jgi:hypothetical protein